jgi:hypothetical protein
VNWPQWAPHVDDIVIALAAGWALGGQLAQERINRRLADAIFKHVGGDLVAVVAAIHALDPAVGKHLVRVLVERAKTEQGKDPAP